MRPHFDDFSVGDDVAHFRLGDGVVTAIENGEVIITYARKSLGKNVIGKYDHRWFDLNPGLMFFRNLVCVDTCVDPY